MKKKCFLIVFLLLAMFTLTGCGNKKALTVDEVKNIVEKEGFKATDVKYKYSNYDYVTDVYELGNSNFYIQFIVASDTNKAKQLFQNNKEIIDGYRNGDYKNSSTSGKNYETYKLISDGYYMYVSRIDNTLIYSNEKAEYKTEIQKIIDALKY